MPPKRKAKKAAPKSTKTAKVAATTSVEKRKTGFLDLPPEMRNVVYHRVLIRGPAIMQIPDRKERIGNDSEVPVVFREPALLATTRQVRAEALPVFYGGNTFAVAYSLYGPKFVRQLGPERTSMLTALRSVGTGTSNFLTKEAWVTAVYRHVRNLMEITGGSLKLDALFVPLGQKTLWVRVKDVREFDVVEDERECELQGLLL